MEKIVVAIATLGRPRMLADALNATANVAVPPGFSLDILVIDNDARESARATAGEARVVPVHYAVEPKKGISEARNRALDVATELGARWLVFIDDDSAPAPDWLTQLAPVVAKSGAQLAGGPVLFVPPDEKITPWQARLANAIARNSHARAERNLRKSRSRPVTVITNNWIADLNWINAKGLRFDPRFSVSGGGDTDFFRRALKAGAKTVWVPDAHVLEAVPSGRLSLAYHFKRQMHSGMVKANWRRRDKGLVSALVRTVPQSLALYLGGFLLIVISPIRGMEALYSAMRSLGKATGSLLGAVGLVPEHYRSIQGY